MTFTRVKICGITRAEDARLAIEVGAAALGFNFYAPSPRFISPAKARGIIERLPPLFMPVGVFADETNDDRVAATARRAGVQAIQLHGPRFPETDGMLKSYPIIRAVAVKEDFAPQSLKKLKARAFLLDTYDEQLRGGTGETFDWSKAREAAQFGPIILAGGLTPENVGRAIRAVRPFAVDVASGVESSPGIKDPKKLRAFFEAVAKADKANFRDRIKR